MSRANSDPIKPHWLSKTLAGLIAGFFLALGGSGLFVLSTPTMEGSIQAQLAMWTVVPLWLTALGSCYLFRSGARAWLWLGVANLLLWLPQLALRLA